MFQAGYAELNAQFRLTRSGSQPIRRRRAASNPEEPAAVDRALLRASAVEVNKLEKRVTFLATTASIAPFIGLFGTVWGIMIAFQRIGATGSTNLAVVGPGICRGADRDGGGCSRRSRRCCFYNHFTTA